MDFDWQDFLELAKLLDAECQKGVVRLPLEAAYRCAIGRAYFAAYGCALRYAVDWLGFRTQADEEGHRLEHASLRSHLRKKKLARVAQQLDQLRSLRNASDYEAELGEFHLTDRLAYAIGAAEYVVSSLVPPETKGAAKR